jgi:protein-tyrosine phosphatase
MSRFVCRRITDRLYGGSLPYAPAHVQQLAAVGVTDVVNLCEDREYWNGERAAVGAAYAGAGITEHRLPVTDGSTVPAAVFDQAVEIAGRGTAFVHCRGGRERSATVCTAILCRQGEPDVFAALRMAQEGNPVFQPLEWQMAALAAWAASES